MTEKQLIIALIICLLGEWWAMRGFWIRCEKDEEEIKRLKEENDGLRVCNQILREELENAHADYEDLVEEMED